MAKEPKKTRIHVHNRAALTAMFDSGSGSGSDDDDGGVRASGARAERTAHSGGDDGGCSGSCTVYNRTLLLALTNGDECGGGAARQLPSSASRKQKQNPGLQQLRQGMQRPVQQGGCGRRPVAREPTSVALERIAKMLGEVPLAACPDGCEGEGEGEECVGGREVSRGGGRGSARGSKFGGRLRSAQQFAGGSSTTAEPPSSPDGQRLLTSQSVPAMSFTR